MLGWHPWFSTRGNMDKASLQFVAKKYVCVNSRLLPINESSVPAKFNFSENKKLKNIALDDAFLNVKNNTIKLTGADGHITIIEADRSYKVWQICSANFPNDENYRFGIAIEPMTAYANSFKTKTNLIILKPSITIKNSWSIDFI
jgi:aldose 1-epimerase